MSRDSTTGVYTAPSNSVNPAVSGTVINSTHFNAMLDDIETALSTASATTRALWPLTSQVQDDGFKWGGTSGGSANAHTITLTPAVTALSAGRTIEFIAGHTNTAAATLAVNGIAATAYRKMTAAGLVALTGGEIVVGNRVRVTDNGTYYILADRPEGTKGADIASATTTDLSAASGDYVDVTGTTTITGLGTAAAGVERTVRFTGALTLTHNATSLILPGASSITTAANDTAIFRSLGSGNWLCIVYSYAAGNAGPASQAQVDSGSAVTSYVAPDKLLAAAWHGSNLENRIINPEGAVLQRSAVGTTDNSYTVDRWRLLLEAANAATVSQVTSSLPTQAQYAIRLTAGSGNNNKFGLWQVIEGINCRDMTGQKVYLTFYAKATSGLSNIKAGIVEFTGTEDSVSGDPISSWGSDGTTPTLAANYAFLNTPANLSVGTSYAQITTIAVTVGSSMKNLAVFIWNDDKTTTQTTDQLEITMIELRHGAAALPYRARPITVEQELCARYYWRMLQTGSGNTVLGSGYCTSTTNARLGIRLPVPARATPTIGGGGYGLYVSDITGTVNSSAAAIFGTTAGLAMVNVDITVSAGLTSGAPCSAFFNTAIDLTFSMEL